MKPIVFLAAVSLTLLGVWIFRRHAPRWGLVDVANARSSHSGSVPRGGGVAIVLAVLATAAVEVSRDQVERPAGIAFLVAALAIAVVGLLDDRHSIPSWIRLAVQTACSLAVILAVGAVNDTAGWLAVAMSLFWLVGNTNVYNFMDGTDGLAAMQGVFLSLALYLVARIVGVQHPPEYLLIAACGACLGFLVWNWPPASIFMGDVGSGFLGFTFAFVSLELIHGGVPAAAVLILFATFLADASVTLVRRMIRRERWYSAHRSHAYQRLARRWQNHRAVLFLFTFINFLWLLPLATLATIWPEYASWIAGLAIAPLAAAAVAIGAGRPDFD